MSKFLEGLNDKQKEAVEYTDGPLLILAGAGSGKTRVLTYKIAYLIDRGIVKPWEILAITFTKKAANEMRDRAYSLHEDATNVWMGTFHSICNRILRNEIEILGYDRSFTIFDELDKNRSIKDIYKRLKIDDKELPINYTLREISNAKNKLEMAKDYEINVRGDFRKEKIAEIYKLYEKDLKLYNAIDFDDIIMLTVKILKENSNILLKYQNKFKYILVDEYQDTNSIQFKLVSMLGNLHGNVCVVGDESQSIYGFRGADISNILNFEKEFKNSKIIKLEENYRSTGNILNAANKIILNNKSKIDKNLWTSKGEGDKINFFEARNEYAEVEFIVDEIDRICREENMTYEDFAVLFRTNAQSRVIEEVFVNKGTPYRLIGGLKFFSRKEIKDLSAYLKFLQNTNDNISLKRIINEPKRGIGDSAVNKLELIAIENNTSIYDVILKEELYSDLRSRNNIIIFKNLIEELKEIKDESSISELMKDILVKSGYEKMLNDENSKEAQNRFENLMEFIGMAVEFEKENVDSSLIEFLENIVLASEVDNIEEGSSLVTLMTMHNSKGLEYKVVFLVGMEEELFPSSRSILEDENAEEERRLFYVGITRAMEKLYLTKAIQRTLYGHTKYTMRSRFIEEIPDNLYTDDFEKKTTIKKEKKQNIYEGTIKSKNKFGINVDSFLKNITSQNNNNDKDLSKYDVGVKVRHKKFGEGVIIKIEPEGDDLKLEIKFDKTGFKRLMGKYAVLEIL